MSPVWQEGQWHFAWSGYKCLPVSHCCVFPLRGPFVPPPWGSYSLSGSSQSFYWKRQTENFSSSRYRRHSSCHTGSLASSGLPPVGGRSGVLGRLVGSGEGRGPGGGVVLLVASSLLPSLPLSVCGPVTTSAGAALGPPLGGAALGALMGADRPELAKRGSSEASPKGLCSFWAHPGSSPCARSGVACCTGLLPLPLWASLGVGSSPRGWDAGGASA